jgi:F420-0:gamma-glutamyl ligase
MLLVDQKQVLLGSAQSARSYSQKAAQRNNEYLNVRVDVVLTDCGCRAFRQGYLGLLPAGEDPGEGPWWNNKRR